MDISPTTIEVALANKNKFVTEWWQVKSYEALPKAVRLDERYRLKEGEYFEFDELIVRILKYGVEQGRQAIPFGYAQVAVPLDILVIKTNLTF